METTATPEDDPTETDAGTQETDAAEPEEPATGEDSPEATENDFAEAFAKRDQFLEDQQQPLDGSNLEAVTPEQQDYIDSYRSHVESQGGTWDAELETVALGLTLDACETAILNSHEANETVLTSHIQSSPLFSALIPAEATGEQREAFEAEIGSTMVYGMGYICPDDHAEWEATFHSMYSDYLGG